MGYLTAIRRAPITPLERAQCARVMLEWLGSNAHGVGEDLVYAGRFAMRPLKRRMLHAPRPARPASH